MKNNVKREKSDKEGVTKEYKEQIQVEALRKSVHNLVDKASPRLLDLLFNLSDSGEGVVIIKKSDHQIQLFGIGVSSYEVVGLLEHGKKEMLANNPVAKSGK